MKLLHSATDPQRNTLLSSVSLTMINQEFSVEILSDTAACHLCTMQLTEATLQTVLFIVSPNMIGVTGGVGGCRLCE